MLVHLSSANTRSGNNLAYDFVNEFIEAIEFKRNANVEVLKVWLNRKEEYVITATNDHFFLQFGTITSPKNSCWITHGTYTSTGLATAVQSALNVCGFNHGFTFNVLYQEGTDKTEFVIEFFYHEPEAIQSHPSGSNAVQNFTYTAATGTLVGSADALEKYWWSPEKLFTPNIPTLEFGGCGIEFEKETNTEGCVVGITQHQPDPTTIASIPFQICFGGTGAVVVAAGYFIIRENNNGFLQTITYAPILYSAGDKFKVIIVKESNKVIYQRRLVGNVDFETIAVNVNIQQDINKFGDWYGGVFASTTENEGLIANVEVRGFKMTYTPSLVLARATLGAETVASTTMTADGTAGTIVAVADVIGGIGACGATYTDAGSSIEALGSGGVSMAFAGSGTADPTGEFAFGLQFTAAQTDGDTIDYSYYVDFANGDLVVRVANVDVATIGTGLWAEDQACVISRTLHGSVAEIEWLYLDNNDAPTQAHSITSGTTTAAYLGASSTKAGEGFSQVSIANNMGKVFTDQFVVLYPDEIGTAIGFRNSRYVSSHLPDANKGWRSDAEPTETTARTPNVFVNCLNLPVKSFQGQTGLVTKSIQAVRRVAGGGEHEAEVFNPVPVPLHNAEPLHFNQIHITLTNADGTLATDYEADTNILIRVSEMENTA